jgi:hypothetical protein
VAYCTLDVECVPDRVYFFEFDLQQVRPTWMIGMAVLRDTPAHQAPAATQPHSSTVFDLREVFGMQVVSTMGGASHISNEVNGEEVFDLASVYDRYGAAEVSWLHATRRHVGLVVDMRASQLHYYCNGELARTIHFERSDRPLLPLLMLWNSEDRAALLPTYAFSSSTDVSFYDTVLEATYLARMVTEVSGCVLCIYVCVRVCLVYFHVWWVYICVYMSCTVLCVNVWFGYVCVCG